MSINWQEFERPANGDFNRWKPENEGDKIAGQITAIRVATMPDGNKFPSLTIDVAGDKFDVLASQTQLLRLLAEKKPEIGDGITIEFTKLEKLAGNKTLKHFTVTVAKIAAMTAEEIL